MRDIALGVRIVDDIHGDCGNDCAAHPLRAHPVPPACLLVPLLQLDQVFKVAAPSEVDVHPSLREGSGYSD